MCAVIAIGASRERAERREVVGELLLGAPRRRQLVMAVGAGAAVAGHVLDDAEHAARLEPVEHRPAERRDLHRLGAERAVADDVVRAGWRTSSSGRQSTLIADLGEHRRAIACGVGARRLDRADRRLLVELGEAPRRRESRAIRGGRSRATRPPSWSIRIGRSARPERSRRVVGQRAQLRAVLDSCARTG